MKKNYLIVGDNNYWYSTFEADSNEEATAELDNVRKKITENFYEDGTTPGELFLFEGNRITQTLI